MSTLTDRQIAEAMVEADPLALGQVAPDVLRKFARALLSKATPDAQRLDWLERQTVVVKQSRRYGSIILFTAINDDEEAIDKRTDLRVKVDAMRQDAAPVPHRHPAPGAPDALDAERPPA
jgi:hypothetical protein